MVFNFTGNNVTVRNCGLDGNKANQVYTGSRSNHDIIRVGASGNSKSGVTLIDNYVTNGMAGAAFEIYADSFDIQNNDFYNHGVGNANLADAIFVMGNNGKIAWNKIYNITDTGIAIDSGSNITVALNEIYGGSDTNNCIAGALDDAEITIEGNRCITETDGRGINLFLKSGYSTVPSNITIKGNRIKSYNYGILVIGNSTTYLSDITVEGNEVSSMVAEAIQVKFVNGTSIIGNTVKNSNTYRAYDLASLTNYIISDNKAIGLGHEHGIICADCFNGTITGNLLKNLQYTGIVMVRGNTSSITGNTVINATTGVSLGPHNYSTVMGNTMNSVTTEYTGNAANVNSVSVKFNFTDNTFQCLVATTNRFCGNGTAV